MVLHEASRMSPSSSQTGCAKVICPTIPPPKKHVDSSARCACAVEKLIGNYHIRRRVFFRRLPTAKPTKYNRRRAISSRKYWREREARSASSVTATHVAAKMRRRRHQSYEINESEGFPNVCVDTQPLYICSAPASDTNRCADYSDSYCSILSSIFFAVNFPQFRQTAKRHIRFVIKKTEPISRTACGKCVFDSSVSVGKRS